MMQEPEADRDETRALIAANPDRLQDNPAAMRALARMRMSILLAMKGGEVRPPEDIQAKKKAQMLAEATKLRQRADELEVLALGQKEEG